MNHWRSKEFKDLKREWYQKLKESGFQDIEDTESPMEFLKVWHSSYFVQEKRQLDLPSKEEYFTRAKHFLEQSRGCPLFFSTNFVEIVWALHTEGNSLRTIAKTLKSQGIRTNKDDVNKAIHSVKKIMNE